MNRYCSSRNQLCRVGLALAAAGCGTHVTAAAAAGWRHRTRFRQGRAGHGRQQLQGGPSGAVSGGDRRRIPGRAGTERDRRGEPGRVAAGAGAVAGLGPGGGNRRAAGRRGARRGSFCSRSAARDIAGAFSDYRKAVKNEQLAKIQLDRAKLLFDNGAIPKSALEIAQNAEDNAKVDLRNHDRAPAPAGVRSRPSDRHRRSATLRFRA